ncbi:MAG TPA: leucine-rich repeat protein [Ruminococcus sp.]
MKLRKILASFFAVTVIGLSMPTFSTVVPSLYMTASAEKDYTEETYDDFTVKKYGDHVEISEYNGKAAKVEIPSKIGGLPVTSIGDYAFYDCFVLTSVTLPASIKSIGNGAFKECKRLASINLPDSVTTIGADAFYYCASLAAITIPDSVTSISDSAFYRCESFTSINIPNTVTSIGDSAFSGCIGLKTITITESVTEIGAWTFGNCNNLASIILPDSVKSIGNDAFHFCSALEFITIPDSVTSIEDSTFSDCTSLEEITIPYSVTSIGVWAFDNCENLKSVTILNPYCKIADNAGTISNSYDFDTEIYTYTGVIKGGKGSTAAEYAKKYNKTFESLDNSPLYGDADGDGKITANDASLVLTEYAALSAGKATFTTEQTALSDVDDDGKITANDASNILMFYAYLSGKGTETDIKIWLKNLN